MNPLPSREEVQEWFNRNGFWLIQGETDTRVVEHQWSTGWAPLMVVAVGTTYGPVVIGWRWP